VIRDPKNEFMKPEVASSSQVGVDARQRVRPRRTKALLQEKALDRKGT